jgi:succinylglutamate desuccinylase
MIRQSRERRSGELELLVRPLKISNNDTDSEDAYDNGLLNINEKNPLEQSLETLRDDLTTGHLIEQYEVSEIFLHQMIRIYHSIQTIQRRKEGFTFEISTSQNNYYRNRYKDVLPYDQTRVILQLNPDNDYINANFINVRNF